MEQHWQGEKQAVETLLLDTAFSLAVILRIAFVPVGQNLTSSSTFSLLFSGHLLNNIICMHMGKCACMCVCACVYTYVFI